MREGARGEGSEKNHCLLPSPPPPSFSVSTLLQHSRGWNFYFANRKRKKTPQKLPAMQAIFTRLTLWNCLFEIYDGSKCAVVRGGFRAGGDVQRDTWRLQSGSYSFRFIISVLLSDETQVGLAIKLRLQYGFCGELESLTDYYEICPLIKRFSNYVSSTNVMAKCFKRIQTKKQFSLLRLPRPTTADVQ